MYLATRGYLCENKLSFLHKPKSSFWCQLKNLLSMDPLSPRNMNWGTEQCVLCSHFQWSSATLFKLLSSGPPICCKNKGARLLKTWGFFCKTILVKVFPIPPSIFCGGHQGRGGDPHLPQSPGCHSSCVSSHHHSSARVLQHPRHSSQPCLQLDYPTCLNLSRLSHFSPCPRCPLGSSPLPGTWTPTRASPHSPPKEASQRRPLSVLPLDPSLLPFLTETGRGGVT